MTSDEALQCARILAETYGPKGGEWTPERFGVWAAASADMPLTATREAIVGWVRNEPWPPTPSDIRKLVADNQAAAAERARIDQATAERLALEAGSGGESGPVPPEKVHLWRAVLGQPPVPGCPCSSCEAAGAVRSRVAS